MMRRTSERTVERPGEAGVEVIALDDERVDRGGGLHCSTAPLVRSRV